jgi:two-component system chemotaxis response regulator CheB
LATRDIIVVGASTGGVEALCQFVSGLPPGFPAAVFIVCHTPSEVHSHLPEILSRQGPLLARHAREGEPIYPGHIYVAPPDFHLLMTEGVIRLSRGPRENRFRPAIDPLFRSAARVYGSRVLAVLLSGALSDGVAGLMAVRAAGGIAVVQDPADAILPVLPQNARDLAGADHVVTARKLPALLVDLIQQDSSTGGALMNDPVDKIAEKVAEDFAAQTQNGRKGNVSVFTCPECGGCLWQLDEEKLLRFRCHVGHAYAADVLLAEQSAVLEAALWTAVRTFKEKGVLSRQLANREREAGNTQAADRHEEDAHLADHYGGVIHNYLTQGMQAPDELTG